MTLRSDNKLSQAILHLAARDQGMCTTDLTGYTVDQVSMACFRLGQKGEIFKAKIGHRTQRWFTDPAKAKAYVERHTAVQQITTASAPPQSRVRWAPSAETVITDDTKITVGPTYSSGPAWSPPRMQPVRAGAFDHQQFKSRGF